jgi:gliding motility-associated-like protein
VQNGTYLWSTGASTQTIDIEEAGVYWVTANANGCVLKDTITIEGSIGNGVIWFPNTFTPNKNGLNDFFTGKGTDITYFDLMIFNRWGELIFETEKLDEGWDGFYKGRLAEQDVYVWKVKYKTFCSHNKIISKIGHVTLLH